MTTAPPHVRAAAKGLRGWRRTAAALGRRFDYQRESLESHCFYCRGKSDLHHREKGRPLVTKQYQVNLVFRDSNLTRRNVSQQKYPDRVSRIARELAEFLDVPLVNYVGPTRTMDAGDSEMRRLLDEG